MKVRAQDRKWSETCMKAQLHTRTNLSEVLADKLRVILQWEEVGRTIEKGARSLLGRWTKAEKGEDKAARMGNLELRRRKHCQGSSRSEEHGKGRGGEGRTKWSTYLPSGTE